MGIEWVGGLLWRRAGSARGSTTDDMRSGTAAGETSLLTVDDWEKHEEEIYCLRRRRRTAGAETPKTFAMLMVRSCGNGHRKRWRTESNFGGRSESFDEHHGASTVRAAPKIFRTIGG